MDFTVRCYHQHAHCQANGDPVDVHIEEAVKRTTRTSDCNLFVAVLIFGTLDSIAAEAPSMGTLGETYEGRLPLIVRTTFTDTVEELCHHVCLRQECF